MTDACEIAERGLREGWAGSDEADALARAFLAQQPVIDAARRVADTYTEDDLRYIEPTGFPVDALVVAVRALPAAPPEATP